MTLNSYARPLTTGAALILLALGSAQAQVGTDSLNGWTSFGDIVSQGGALTLSTAALDDGPDASSNRSGISTIEIGPLETAAGLSPYALDVSPAEYGTEGSLALQSFSVVAGQTLSFNWSFSSQESQFQDHAFAVIGNQLFSLATTAQPGGASQGFSYTFGQSGTVSLALGVIDTVDYQGVSTLSVSNLQISAVPEPTSIAMMLAGLAAVGFMARRRRAD